MSLDNFLNLFIVFGIYCAFKIQKIYKEYKKTKGLFEWSDFIRSLGVIFGSILVIIYKIIIW